MTPPDPKAVEAEVKRLKAKVHNREIECEREYHRAESAGKSRDEARAALKGAREDAERMRGALADAVGWASSFAVTKNEVITKLWAILDLSSSPSPAHDSKAKEG